MKVLFLNTFDQYGGAAIAFRRALEAIEKNTSIKSKVLVQKKESSKENIYNVQKGYFGKKKALFRFAYERLFFSFLEKEKKYRFQFSPANIGVDITQHPFFKEADIIHLHWINFGFLSLKSLQKITASNKPIVWTLHDMWAFTGGCHYVKTCTNYVSSCGNCLYLKKPKPNDISQQIHNKKQKVFANQNINIVTTSHWLKEVAKKSSLFKNQEVVHIPTPLDTNIFKPLDKTRLQKNHNLDQNKYWLLFGAMNISDERKGFEYFKKSLEILKEKYPNISEDLQLLVFGKSTPEILSGLPFPIHNLGMLKGSNKMVEAYNLAHAFIIPTLEDNLPNTVLESLACSTPVIGFEVGGVPEMVSHANNGFLATAKNSISLAQWIYHAWQIWKNEPSAYKKLKTTARNTITTTYNESIIAQKYHGLYQKILNQ